MLKWLDRFGASDKAVSSTAPAHAAAARVAKGVPSRLGPYELGGLLGKGGMAEVYKAKDTRLDRSVAIKILNHTRMDRFQREAQAIAALNHPNICTLYDVGPDYLVMEFIEGAPMRGPLPADEARRLALQIADALETAHARGIIHRDLKPGNILVTRSGIKLLDFGLAKTVEFDRAAAAGDTAAGTILGTPAYMSPEQASGQRADARSDIFSFGLLLYEMLCGRGPFTRDNVLATLAAVLHDEPEPLEAPADLAAIAARCLQKAAADRYQTMAEVRQALAATGAAPAAKTAPSIAVLPFSGPGGENDFGDGLAEEVITMLARIPGLKVIARTSAFAFRGREQDVRSIARALNVRSVLEGSVRRDGGRVRVTAQLVDARDGSQTWSERYDRDVTDVFAVQDEIAEAICRSLRVAFTKPGGTREKHRPEMPAYEAYLRGLHDLFRNTPESLRRCERHLHSAADADPRYAAPHVALGQCRILLGLHGLEPSARIMPKVRAAAQRTLELDQSASLGHAMLGLVAGAFDYDWAEVDRRFGLAMAESPVPGLVRWPYANFCLAPRGRFREAAEQMESWLEEDPLNVTIRTELAFFLNHAGQHDRAAAAARLALEIDAGSWFAHYTMAEIHAAAGRFADAAAAAERAWSAAPWNPRVVGLLAGALARTGDRERSRQLLRGLEGARPVGMLMYHLLNPEIEAAALWWYERAIRQRELFTVLYARTPIGDPLRKLPGWGRLAAMMNLD